MSPESASSALDECKTLVINISCNHLQLPSTVALRTAYGMGAVCSYLKTMKIDPEFAEVAVIKLRRINNELLKLMCVIQRYIIM